MSTVLLYVFWLTLAELITVFIDPLPGIGLYFLILISTVVIPAVQNRYHPSRITLALSLVPIIRIISLSMPLTDIPQIWWYPIIYVPLLLATVFMTRVLGYRLRDVAVTWGYLPYQLLIAATGVFLGIIEWFIIRPDPIVTEFSIQTLLLPAFMLVATTGFVEELIFRGVLQKVALESFGNIGLVLVSFIFAVLHIGFLSILDVLFVFLVALIFSFVVKKTGSLFGVTLAHGFTNVVLFLIAPYVLG